MTSNDHSEFVEAMWCLCVLGRFGRLALSSFEACLWNLRMAKTLVEFETLWYQAIFEDKSPVASGVRVYLHLHIRTAPCSANPTKTFAHVRHPNNARSAWTINAWPQHLQRFLPNPGLGKQHRDGEVGSSSHLDHQVSWWNEGEGEGRVVRSEGPIGFRSCCFQHML